MRTMKWHGRNLIDLGIQLKGAILESPGNLGTAAKMLEHLPVATIAREATADGKTVKDLLPLPHASCSADERRQTRNERLPKRVKSARWREGVGAWMFMAVLLVNLLNCGCAAVTVESMRHVGPITRCQDEALCRIEDAVRQMLREAEVTREPTDWVAAVGSENDLYR